jgi:hypothetical protein
MPRSVGGIAAVQLDEDPVGLVAKGGCGADGGGEDDPAPGGHVTGFHDGPIHVAEKAVAGDLRHQGEVHVAKGGLALVDAVAEVVVGLVGRAETDGAGFGEGAVEGRTGGGAGKDADLEGTAGIVFDRGRVRQCEWDGFGRAGRSESAETDSFAVPDHGGSFGRGKNRK